MAGLGCDALYQARILDRGGAVLLDADVLTRVEYGRLLNGASGARIVVDPDMGCCGQIGEVRSWRHQLVIYRNGRIMWSGPVAVADWSSGQVEIDALDLWGLLTRRVPHADITFDQADSTEVARWLIDDGLAPDDPGHTVAVAALAGVRTVREYTEDVGQSGDHLVELTESGGIDATVVGSTFVLLPDDWSESVGTLTDADLPDGLSVVEDGEAVVTRWVVHGPDGSGIKAVAGGEHPYYGLIERVVQDTSVQDQTGADAAARSRLAASLPAPVYVDSQQVTLSPDAGVDLGRLVPGWCVDVATTATCRNIVQRLKLMGLRVVVDGGGESIQVQLGPVSGSGGV